MTLSLTALALAIKIMQMAKANAIKIMQKEAAMV